MLQRQLDFALLCSTSPLGCVVSCCVAPSFSWKKNSTMCQHLRTGQASKECQQVSVAAVVADAKGVAVATCLLMSAGEGSKQAG